MVEVETGEALSNRLDIYRLEICLDNKWDANTLIPLIEKHVVEGTTIITDLWGDYNSLHELEFNHLTVNLSLNIVDPHTYAHTQNIESSWRPFKKNY